MGGKVQNGKAIVHVSGTRLRETWRGPKLQSCIVVRPSGQKRDRIAYVVNQVRFSGPTEMIFSVKPRTKRRASSDLCAKAVSGKKVRVAGARETGYIGTLPGFDNAILVYLQADEDSIHVQPSEGDSYVSFNEFKSLVRSNRIKVPIIDPREEANC